MLLTETCVHCKSLISPQHRWGQLSFSAQSIQNVSRNSGLFSTVGTFSLIYLSAGWMYVELGFLSPCKVHNYFFLQSMLLSTSLIPDLYWPHRMFHKPYSPQQYFLRHFKSFFFKFHDDKSSS